MTVSTDLRGPIAVLTLHDPERHNALSAELVGQMLRALQALDRQPVRAIVITAQGRFFSAGANIGDLHSGGWMSEHPHPNNPVTLFQALADHRLPVIAAVTGPALGGGFELSLSCDLVVMSDSAYFAAPELGLGVIANTAMARLTALVGRRRALEILYTRRKVPAAEALSLGLANEVVDAAQVVDAAVLLATRVIRDAPPGALAAVKHGVDRHGPTDWQEVRACLPRLPQAEWKEGLGAFVEKRPPDFEPFWTKGATSNKQDDC